MVRRYDAFQYRKPEVLPNGFLKADAVLTRTGVFLYRLGDGTTRRELRLPEEVGAPESLASFQMLPVTDDHPVVPVTQDNATTYARGSIGDTVQFDGQYVAAPVLITDGKLVKKVQSGQKDQVSLGYDCDLEMTAGTHPQFGQYDAIQRNIRGNHVAIVAMGRAGPAARVRMDAADGAMAMGPDGMPMPPDEMGSEMGGDDIAAPEPMHADLIRHEGGKWVLYSSDGSKKLGEHDTRAGAEQQEAAVRAQQHSNTDDAGAVPGRDRSVQPTSDTAIKTDANHDARHKRMSKIRIDGFDYEPEQVPQVLERRDAAQTAKLKQVEDQLATARADAEKARKDAEVATADAKAKLDKETARADGLKSELDKAQKAHADAADPKAVQALVKARVALETRAGRVLGSEAKIDSMTDAEIGAAMLKKLEPKLDTAGKSADYLQARLDFALERFEAENSGLSALRRAAEGGRNDGEQHKDIADVLAEQQRKLDRQAASYRPALSSQPKA